MIAVDHYCWRLVLCAERAPTELVAAVGSLGEDILTGTNEDLQQFVAEDFRPDEVRRDSSWVTSRIRPTREQSDSQTTIVALHSIRA